MILTLLPKQELLLRNKRTLFAHDESIQQAIEALSFEPIPINSIFHKEEG
jgi:hypothetical protein